ncbi:TetR/AcrR family transcriptional regulator [Mycolicibacterium brumae]|uniref:TetR/AcrR family transcriptional regulator n=1 Tax=Mycolicibacterium brumae TaxID=85968 RepID=UPI000A6BA50D|nr:TetR/AcrR family transcriptional regulator [Mycolicibacterium brumae]RWA17816.1 hypothetical protein MBRU_18450 [Mycolicibacterium brumae DSM 44177]UWW09733.1 TetR/AcrR family transcriptional regulator [Mycolicibacterium brumae]
MSTTGTKRVYGGMSAEQRVAERRAKLIDAGLNLFGSGESAQVRVKDVVAEAGLTERYFYESFKDMAAFFDAVFECAADMIESQVNAVIVDAPEDGFARVSLALRTTVELLAADPRLIRLFFVEALGKGDRAGAHRNDILVRAAENFLHWSTVGTPSGGDGRDARLKAFAMSGATSELLIAWADGLIDVTPAELSDFLVGLYWRANLP